MRYIAGLSAMEHGGKEVYVRDCEGDTAKLFVGSCEVYLTPEEMRHLAKCLNEAAYRADLRKFKDTPDEPKDAE